jgi:hypothetical protein
LFALGRLQCNISYLDVEQGLRYLHYRTTYLWCVRICTVVVSQIIFVYCNFRRESGCSTMGTIANTVGLIAVVQALLRITSDSLDYRFWLKYCMDHGLRKMAAMSFDSSSVGNSSLRLLEDNNGEAPLTLTAFLALFHATLHQLLSFCAPRATSLQQQRFSRECLGDQLVNNYTTHITLQHYILHQSHLNNMRTAISTSTARRSQHYTKSRVNNTYVHPQCSSFFIRFLIRLLS